MLIEHNAGDLEKTIIRVDENMHSQVMIKNLQEDINRS